MADHEIIDPIRVPAFLHLWELDHEWRKVLSNFFVGEFEYNGFHYRSAEHAFQGSKILMVSPSIGREFSLESGSVLSKGDGILARKNRKLVLLTNDQLKLWEKEKDDVMKNILFCKFSQVDHAKNVLLATLDAELWHGARGIRTSRQFILEQIRTSIAAKSSIESKLCKTIAPFQSIIDSELSDLSRKKRRLV